MTSKIRVAVIGAGGAGLCAARYMAAKPHRFEPVVFEKTNSVGGTWVYTEDVGKDKNGQPIHSSMYASMKTNLPKEVMAFPDFPFSSHLPSFVKHTDVREYTEQYAQHFDLLKYIQFCTAVECVKPVRSEDESRPLTWEVKVQDVCNKGAKPVTSVFDAVIVCNGHYALPKIPPMKGLDTFPGRVFHSHDYRHPSIFEGQSVLVVGAGASGMDIALDMASSAKTVYLSHWRKRIQSSLPGNVVEVQAVRTVSERQVEFTDGTTAEIDAILFCSGYDYDFSFLHPDCRLDVTDGRVTPLYKHLLHIRYPSLSIVGIAIRICPFPHFSAQVQFILAMLDGSMKLPSEAEMLADEDRDYQKKLGEGLPHRYAHLMDTRQWGYNAELLRMARAEQPKPVVEKLYKTAGVFRRTDVCNYKRMDFKLIDDDNFQQLQLVER